MLPARRLQLVPAGRLPRAKCTLGCPVLDALLGGGLPCGSLTELVGGPAALLRRTSSGWPRELTSTRCAGESGAAKTQTSLQLLLSAQWPEACGGLSGSSLCAASGRAACRARSLPRTVGTSRLTWPAGTCTRRGTLQSGACTSCASGAHSCEPVSPACARARPASTCHSPAQLGPAALPQPRHLLAQVPRGPGRAGQRLHGARRRHGPGPAGPPEACARPDRGPWQAAPALHRRGLHCPHLQAGSTCWVEGRVGGQRSAGALRSRASAPAQGVRCRRRVCRAGEHSAVWAAVSIDAPQGTSEAAIGRAGTQRRAQMASPAPSGSARPCCFRSPRCSSAWRTTTSWWCCW